MAKQRYITFREENEKGELCYYILQKAFPHCVGLISLQPDSKAVMQSVVSGYNLWIIADGVLRGNFIAIYAGYEDNLLGTFQDMANWFLENRIMKDEKRYEKFKVK